ncbi:centrosomal protein of 170 kDa protein B isoform X2 [Pangasianodon hypophthalmus]|uniref:centrosomal protein of 170 kDa protein B isoform X2 n=1 Tax=Pangasianodon hypophthalmus TaxID=310915 RepID=UPI000F00F84B|nr:centrosomal protein of 170 kDa protein B isoform X2 [Pangasianodon hypophthalmus]
MSVTSWFLVSSSGTRHRLPREMIFVGREDCELMLQSRSVDKQHAVINYDPTTDEHLVKDLGSLNGTFVNDLRIPDQTYITLKLSDVVRFGYDSHVYIMERSQHKVPEEALKHEKYTSQLQVGVNPLELGKTEQVDEKTSAADVPHSKHEKNERKSNTEPPVFKPTPLYGQPSWWGDVDEDNKGEPGESSSNLNSAEKQKEDSRQEFNGPSSEHQGKTIYSSRRDASYFEITTKELQSRPKATEQEVQVIPTKDTVNKAPPTPPVVQSHASFTIEFDDCTPGKIKIKDHVTKFSFRQRKNPSKESLVTPTEVMSSESKVADWLVQTGTSMMGRNSRSDDLYTTKSDLSKNRNTLKDGHHHEDGTQSDSEDPVSNPQDLSRELTPQQLFTPPEREEPPMTSTPRYQIQPKKDPQQAFVISFLDDDVHKSRSQSFTSNMSPAESHVALKRRTEKTKGAVQSGVSLTSSAVQSAPTQRFTIPLKGSDGSQKAGLLRREKSDILASNSNFSSRSASSRPFGSVGRKSRLALDFVSEFLKVSKPSSTAKSEKSLSSTRSKASSMVSEVADNSTQSQPSAMDQTYILSTSQQLEPSKALHTSTSTSCTDEKTPKGSRHEEEDTLSDAGTYTIETEGPDKEVNEARNMIDQVFGVLECPEYSSQPSAASVYRSVEGDREAQDILPLSENSPGPTLGHNPGYSDPAMGPAQAGSVVLTTGDTKWVSRWASLADGYSDSGPISGQIDISTQMGLSGAGQIIPQSMHNRTNESTGAEDGQTFRARRILPQLPTRGEGQVPPPSIHVQSESYLTYDSAERNIQGSLQKDHQKLYVADDLDPDSLSDASKSDDGSIIEQGRKTSTGKSERTCSEFKAETSSKQDVMADHMLKDQDCPTKFSTATITRQYGSRKAGDSSVSPSGKDASTCMENAVSLIRQESFTKHRSSDDIHFMKLPHISSPESSNDTNAFKGVCNQDTQSYLKETENALAVLEAKLQVQKHNRASCPQEDSLSGESDVDTSSTVSQRSGKNSGTSAPIKPVILSELLKGKKTASQRAQEQLSSGDPQSQKCRASSGDSNYKESGKTSQSATIHQWSDAVSDQESSSQPVHRKYTIPLQKESSRRSLKGTVTQVLARSGSLSAPKPTRTSMLRRARLGDASDNDGTETDRTSQNSDANPSSTRTQESKKLSRLDLLALPRRRTGSFTTPSDTESSAGRTGFSSRSEAESGFSARKASVPDLKTGTQRGSGATGRQPIIRGRSSSAKYASSTARALHNSRTQAPDQVRPPSRSRDSEGEGHESENFQNWTTHSAEIARLSQDLAKDLAILAQEIHNVAGDGEPQNAASVDAVEPVSAISACKELRQQLPETSINYSKVLQSSAMCKNPDQTVSDQGLKHQSWKQEQVALDNSMLNPVSQLSMAIRENTEQLTEKLKLLFHNKAEVWEEIETVLDAADDSPPLESPNKEIMSIIRDLRGIQKRLEVINTVIEPSGNVSLVKSSPVLSHSSAGLSSFRASPRDWRATASQRAAGSPASARRFVRGNDGRVL